MDTQPINLSLPLSEDPTPGGDAIIRLNPRDQVALAMVNLQSGMQLLDHQGEVVLTVRQFIASGHKIALQDIEADTAVYRYGRVIGTATQPIRAGEHIHTHNLALPEVQLGAETEAGGESLTISLREGRRFMGYTRADGRVGTRNYIAVIATSNCSATVCEKIAHHFDEERLKAYDNVDGVIALTHASGCSIRIGGPEYVWLQRTLAGMARHPNVGAYLLVGLGCEVNQTADLLKTYGLDEHGVPSLTLSIQDSGGIGKTVEAGINAIERFLPVVDDIKRIPQPLSGLTLALQCGGSDGWSGVTANPLVGLVADEVVRQGGTVVLAETPEIYGAEHLLTQRATRADVAQKLLDRVEWWKEHTQRFGTEIDNNPTPGNKAGGLTNIVEKALGAVAKGGSTPLMDVYEYAEPVTERGLTFMDTPGNDPIAVTGQVAGGSNLVLFTTGRGSVFGFKPAPSLKIATNTALYERMFDDMDFDAGLILAGADPINLAEELLDLVISVASGAPSKSEAQGVGEREFSPWYYGDVV